jgi:signal transduction histidine kinase
MDSPRGQAQLLPGMAEIVGHQGDALVAVIAQLTTWKESGTLTTEHVALAQLCISLAKSIDVMLSTGKVSMLSNNAHELRETLAAIRGEQTDDDGAIQKLIDELNNA